MLKEIMTWLVAIFTTVSVNAQGTSASETAPRAPLSEEATISILTSGPSDMAIFTAWGHSAIRVRDPQTSSDMVYNYGIFSFGEPLSFVARFVSGQTDYRLGRTSMQYSMRETMEKNADYYEQVLNLSQSEKERFYGALQENYKPENRVYRYKYFSDNCATRPRAILKKSIEGNLTYDTKGEDYQTTFNHLYTKEDGRTKTYRDIIYELLPTSPWYCFGIDLCLGQPTDKPVNGWDQLFLPIELKEEIAHLQIEVGDSTRQLVKQTNQLLTKQTTEKETEWSNVLGPQLVFWTLALFTLLHAIYYTATGRDDRWVYLLFFGICGVLGSIVFYVSCLSVHEFVFPNYNLLWLNPLHLLVAAFIFRKRALRTERLLMTLTSIGSTTALVYMAIGHITQVEVQQFNNANLPLIIMQLILSWTWLRRNPTRGKKKR